MTEVHNPSVIYEDNPGFIFLPNNRQVGMCTKHIYIRHHSLRDRVEDKYIDIKYIFSEENPAYIMTKNTSETAFLKHMKRITEGDLWDLVETGRENFRNTRVTYDFIKHENTEYSSHALAAFLGG